MEELLQRIKEAIHKKIEEHDCPSGCSDTYYESGCQTGLREAIEIIDTIE